MNDSSILVAFSRKVGERALFPWQDLIPLFIEIILACFATQGATPEQFRQQALNPSLLQRAQLRARLRRSVIDAGVPLFRRAAAVSAIHDAIKAELQQIDRAQHERDPWEQAMEEATLLQ